jgi:hypothetical protein
MNLIHRGQKVGTGEWVYGTFLPYVKINAGESREHIIVTKEGDVFNVNYETIGIFSDLFDRLGKKIFTGDRLRFFPCLATKADNDGCIWEADVSFEEGVFTINMLTVSQVQNPRDWCQEHDWVKSRNLNYIAGWGEYGAWNVPRKSLTEIHTGFGNSRENLETLYKPIAEKVGWGKRFLNVEVVGNNFDHKYCSSKKE